MRILRFIIVIILIGITYVLWNIHQRENGYNTTSKISATNNTLFFPWKEQIYAIDLDGHNLRKITTDSQRKFDPVVSADGTKICYSRQIEGQTYDYADLYIADSDGKNPQRIFEGKDSFIIYQPIFSPDGRRIAFNWHNSTNLQAELVEVNTDNKTSKILSKTSVWDVDPLVYSPDGLFILGGKHDTLIKINTKTLAQEDTKFPSMYGQTISTDLKKTITKDEGAIIISNIDGSETVSLMPGSRNDNTLQATFTPDGRRVIFFMKGSLYIENADGSNLKTLVPVGSTL